VKGTIEDHRTKERGCRRVPGGRKKSKAILSKGRASIGHKENHWGKWGGKNKKNLAENQKKAPKKYRLQDNPQKEEGERPRGAKKGKRGEKTPGTKKNPPETLESGRTREE